jgi:hypothetical protein
MEAKTIMLSKDANADERTPLLKRDDKADARATQLRNERKAGVQATDKKVDHTSKELRSDRTSAAKSLSAEKLPSNKLDLKMIKLLSQLHRNAMRNLARELEFLEYLERKEKNRLEEGDWYP